MNVPTIYRFAWYNNARDPDAILTATPHTQDGAFSIEATLRDFKAVPQFVIRWEYPRMVRDYDLDPADLAKAKQGRPGTFTVLDIMGHIGTEPLTNEVWKKTCVDEEGMSGSTFARLKKEAVKRKLIAADGGKWKVASGQSAG